MSSAASNIAMANTTTLIHSDSVFVSCCPLSFILPFRHHSTNFTHHELLSSRKEKSFHESYADTHERYIPLRGKSIIPLLWTTNGLATLEGRHSLSYLVFLSISWPDPV